MGGVYEALPLLKALFETTPGIFVVYVFAVLLAYNLLASVIGTRAERTLDKVVNNRLNDVISGLHELSQAITQLAQSLP